jgi:hypothetical protein
MDSDTLKAFVLLAGGEVAHDISRLAYKIKFLLPDSKAGDAQRVIFSVPDDIDEDELVAQLMLARATVGKTELHDP